MVQSLTRPNGLIRQGGCLDLSLNHWVAFLRRAWGINCVDLELLLLLRLPEPWLWF